MPEYIFKCEDCETEFSEVCSMSEIQTLNVGCPNPDCYSLNVIRNFKAESKHGFEGPKTLGALADKNSSKISKDEKEYLKKKHFAYLENRSTEKESYERGKK